MPAFAVDQFGFEKRLGRRDDRLDFQFNLSSWGVDWLHRSNRWPTICAMSREWQSSVSERHNGSLWLEFDTSADSPVQSEPCAFFAFDRARGGAIVHKDVIERMLRASASGHIDSADALELFGSFVNALPDGASRLHIGFMLGRRTVFRLCASRLTCDATLKFLRTVAPESDLCVVETLLRRYGVLADNIGIHVSRAASREFTIGLELLSADSALQQPAKRLSQWALILTRLVRDGFCDDDERTALLAWPGRSTFHAPLIEVLISGVERPESRILDGTFHRCLQHIKVSADAKGRVHAKAYVGAVLTRN